MIFKKSNTDLINVLIEINDYLNKYDNISWEGLSPAEAKMDLEIAIEKLRTKSRIDKKHLKILFAPTGLIQECAMANDWEQEYFRLSEKFDNLIEKV
jgi:DNA-binding transcriptional regulator PaaX